MVRQQEAAVRHLRHHAGVASTEIVTVSTRSDGSPHTSPTESQLAASRGG